MTKDAIILETESNIGVIKKGKIAAEVIRGPTGGYTSAAIEMLK